MPKLAWQFKYYPKSYYWPTNQVGILEKPSTHGLGVILVLFNSVWVFLGDGFSICCDFCFGIFCPVKVHHFCEEKERNKREENWWPAFFGATNFAKMKKRNFNFPWKSWEISKKQFVWNSFATFWTLILVW